MLAAVFLFVLTTISLGEQIEPRRVRVKGQKFVELTSSGENEIVMSGPNVVVKGFPYLPSVSGSEICLDVVNDSCSLAGTCISCSTFNLADVKHIKAMGWNTIRLG